MRVSDQKMRQVVSDLGLNVPFVKGKSIQVNNCWHFSTDGNAVDAIFQDDEDFRCGMNRVFFAVRKYEVIILAFCLMDTHVHFVLYGNFDDCNSFMHEYVRQTSQYIQKRYLETKKLADLPISYQSVDTDDYLKTCICYVIKNPPVGGLHFSYHDYPWSSGPLMFRRQGYWSSPGWTDPDYLDKTDKTLRSKRRMFQTRCPEENNLSVADGIIFPGEYVAYEIAELLFRTHRSFLYFMCKSKESDVESRGGAISYLTLPMQEMRQHKAEACMEMFGRKDVRSLDVTQRLLLARTLKSRYNSSLKQIVRLCGLNYQDALPFLK